MNKNAIFRTVVTTVCNGQRMGAGGEYEDFTDALIGEYTAEQATKSLRRMWADRSIVVNNCEYERARYRMDYKTFLKHAEIVD